MDNFMLFLHQPFLISIDSWLMNWCSLEMHLKFFLDCLTVWQKVVLLCLLAIHQLSWRSKNELHWCLHESFIFNDLEVSFVWPWLFRTYKTQSTVNHWLMMSIAQECTPLYSGISLSWSLLLMCELVFLKTMEACIFWLMRGGLHLASHQNPSLSLEKAQC
jgi:hypothetical protein